MTALLYPGSPTQTNAGFVVGRSRGLVALLWRKASSVAPSAEGESECKSINNFWHLQLFEQKNALQNSDCLYPLIAMQLRGLGGQNLGCWKNFSLFCQKICIYATLYQSNNYGALLMPRFASIAPHRPIYRGLGVLIGFCVLSAGIVLLSPRLFRQCKGWVFPLSYALGIMSQGGRCTI